MVPKSLFMVKKMKNWPCVNAELRNRMCLITILLCVIAIAILWTAHYVRGPQVWEALDVTYMTYPNGWEVFREKTGYGIVNGGPGLSLQCGTYQLFWEIESDGENQVLLTTDNQVDCFPSSFITPAGKNSGTVQFTLLDESLNLEFLVDFESGTYLRVGTISLTGPRNTDRIWLVTFALLFCIAFAVFVRLNLIKNRNDLFHVICLMAAVILTALPAFRFSIYLGHDGSDHIERLKSLTGALLQGQFPVRISGTLFNGYGNAIAAFYPAFFLYPSALMMLLHASPQFAFQTLLVFLNILTAVHMDLCASSIFKKRSVGLIAALLYLFAPYRISDMFTRVAIGEMAAMAILPLVILGFYQCLAGDKKYWSILSVSFMLLLNVHVLSTALFTIFAVLVSLVLFPKLVREKRIQCLMLSVGMALLLSLSTLAPMLTFFKQGIDTSGLLTLLEENTLTIGNLLGIEGVNTYVWDKASRSVGAGILIAFACFIYLEFHDREHSESRKVARSCIVIGIVFGIMTTGLFPWRLLSQLTGQKSDFFQFPFRLLVFVDLFLSLGSGYACVRMLDLLTEMQDNKKRIGMMLPILGLFFCIGIVQNMPTYTRAWTRYPQYTKGNTEIELFVYPDYLLNGTVVDETSDRTVHTEGEVQISDYEKFGYQIEATVQSSGDSILSFPLFAYDGYSASLNGERLPVIQGDNNRLTVHLSGEKEGKLRITYSGVPIWRICDGISFITLIFAVARFIDMQRKVKRS